MSVNKPATVVMMLSVLLSASVLHAADAPRTEDLLWLERVTYGVDTATLTRYAHLGRKRFLDEQLHMESTELPPLIKQQMDALEIAHLDPFTELSSVNAENRRINSLGDDTEKQDARKALNERGNQLAYEAQRREILYALYSPAQLYEQMVWFWLNHFSVFQHKGNIRWLAGDYALHAIRPHAMGKFRDLVLATLHHPAMLQYLDNNQNTVGHINENYARELMELHTLGVDAGYTQQDVQELARVLTGVGINASDNTPKLKREWQPLYVREGAFEFNPARHDFGTKVVLGKTFTGAGMDEVNATIDWLVQQPACARFITHKLALYFLGQEPSASLQNKLAKTFLKSDGDIRTTLKVLLDSHEFVQSLGTQLKDPVHYVISAVRIAYDGKVIANTRPVVNWLNALGEAPFNRQTPDGYPLAGDNWASSGQMSKRFDIAKAIGSGSAGLFEPESSSTAVQVGFPQLSSRLYFMTLEPRLTDNTRRALDQAMNQTEWNTYLLASPEFNHR